MSDKPQQMRTPRKRGPKFATRGWRNAAKAAPGVHKLMTSALMKKHPRSGRTLLEFFTIRLAQLAAKGDASSLDALLRLIADYPPPAETRPIIVRYVEDDT